MDREVAARDRTWVLVTDGGSGQGRSALAAVRALAASGYRPAVSVSGGPSLAASSRHCRRRVPVPLVGVPGYAEAVRSELAKGRYLTVLAASDAALLALGAPVGHLVDKTLLAHRAAAAGLATIPARLVADAAALTAIVDELDFPLVVKPVVSLSPAQRFDGPESLRQARLPTGPLLVQPFVTEPLSAVAGVVWRGEMVAAVHQRYLRTWPSDCGPASAAETVSADVDRERRLLALLEGYEGIFQAQFVGEFLLDLNPRVYGSLPLAVASGANLPAIWCDLLAGGEPVHLRGRPGVRYRWLEGDVRHAAHSVRSLALLPSARDLLALRPRAGTAHSVESIGDPGPLLARIRHVARRGRAPVVAFSGVDGSGKSTLSARVAEELAREDRPATVVWARPGMRLGLLTVAARSAHRLTKQSEPGVRAVATGKDVASRRGAVGWAWVLLVTLSFLADLRRRHGSAAGVRLYDRHLLDALVTVEFVYRGADLRLARWLIRRFMPPATVTFYLDVDPGTAVARKPGDSFGELAVTRQLELYRDHLAGHPEVVVLDGAQALDALVAEVLAALTPILAASP